MTVLADGPPPGTVFRITVDRNGAWGACVGRDYVEAAALRA